MGRKFRQKPVPDTKQTGTERLECIGIAGSGPSVGVTHFSLMTAAYLSGVLCRRTAVLEQMRAAHLHSLKRYSGREKKGKPVIDGAGQPFEIRGIFFYQKAERAEWYDCSERGMEAMVIDFGALTQKNQDAFFDAAAVFWSVRSADGSWQILRHWQQKSKNGKNGVSISSHLEKRKL